MWNNHLYYAVTWEVEQRFGVEYQKESRSIFSAQLQDHLQKMDIDSEQIHSIFEVGCSFGYQLWHMESDLFTSATKIGGLDIDEYAIENGRKYLESLGSKIELKCGDMERLDDFMGSECHDVIICTGTLMYLDQDSACAVVGSMLKHTKTILGLVGIAHPAPLPNRPRHAHPRGATVRATRPAWGFGVGPGDAAGRSQKGVEGVFPMLGALATLCGIDVISA